MSTDHVSTHPDSPLHGNGIGSEAINLAAIRQEYTKGGLKEGDLPDNPLSLFNRWLHEAIDAQVDEPTAMLVGTVSPEGQPSTRTVLLKDLHDGKFIFYTNYESRKGTHLAKNPYISLSFVWHALERQYKANGNNQAKAYPPSYNLDRGIPVSIVRLGPYDKSPHRHISLAKHCNKDQLSSFRIIVLYKASK